MSILKRIENKRAKDPFDILILEKGLRAVDLVVYKELDLMVLILNNGSVFNFRISDFPRLKKASETDLKKWKMTGGGIAFRWEKLDEDLSLKGFIKTSALNKALLILRKKKGMTAN